MTDNKEMEECSFYDGGKCINREKFIGENCLCVLFTENNCWNFNNDAYKLTQLTAKLEIAEKVNELMAKRILSKTSSKMNIELILDCYKQQALIQIKKQAQSTIKKIEGVN